MGGKYHDPSPNLSFESARRALRTGGQLTGHYQLLLLHQTLRAINLGKGLYEPSCKPGRPGFSGSIKKNTAVQVLNLRARLKRLPSFHENLRIFRVYYVIL